MRFFAALAALALADEPKLDAKTCYTKPVKHLKGKLALLENPGFGTGEVKAFEKVYKDGYMQSDCVKDDMLEFADKFGKNRHAYKADFVDVSIVRYADVVASEDQQKMTPDVCFDFCRTIDGAGFFGLHNGRDCYCTPYYKTAAGDSSQCDAPCDGAPHLSCGGKSKSAVYAMHACNDQVSELKDISAFAKDVSGLCKVRGDASLLKAVQHLGDDLKKRAGQAGDEAASNNGQAAVVFAGEMKRAAEGAVKVAGEIDGLASSIDSELGSATEGQQLSVEQQRKADAAVKQWDSLLGTARTACGSVKMAVNAVKPQNAEGAGEQFFGMNYFTEYRKLGKTPAEMPDVTCKGEILLSTGAHSFDDCAAICTAYGDNASDKDSRCVAVEFYKPGTPTVGDFTEDDFAFEEFDAPIDEEDFFAEEEWANEWDDGAVLAQIKEHKADGKQPTLPAKNAGPGGLCTLFKDVNEINVYTKECGAAPSFLQTAKGEGAATIRCAGHFASLKGFDHRVNSKEAGVDQVAVKDFNRCF